MTTANRVTIYIHPGRPPIMIHDDAAADLIDALRGTTRRASHVEPHPDGGWTADLGPVGGPVLGPFRLRGEALAAERAWLERALKEGTIA